MDQITRFLPLAAIALLFAVSIGGRALLQRKRHGTSGIVLERGRLWFSLGAALLPLAFVVQALLRAIDPRALEALRLLDESPLLDAAGAAIVVASIVLMTLAQLQMGASWRIGIDREARPGLVQSGFYRFSRNPIYACLFFTLLGLAALLPTWPTLLCGALGIAGVLQQVGNEEAYLRATYGEDYDAYAARVGRFLPRL